MKVEKVLELYAPAAAERAVSKRATSEVIETAKPKPQDKVSVSDAVQTLSAPETRNSASEARLIALQRQFEAGQLPLVASKTARAMLDYERIEDQLAETQS